MWWWWWGLIFLPQCRTLVSALTRRTAFIHASGAGTTANAHVAMRGGGYEWTHPDEDLVKVTESFKMKSVATKNVCERLV